MVIPVIRNELTKLKTILDLSISKEAIIQSIATEERQVVAKLISLGIVPGAEVSVVQKGVGGGPIIIKVGASEVAIGHGIARVVYVKEMGDE